MEEIVKPTSPILLTIACSLTLLILTITQQSFAARTLGNHHVPPPPGQRDSNTLDQARLEISFSMSDVLGGKHDDDPSSRPGTTKVNSHESHPRFSKPLLGGGGYYPPVGGIINPFANLDPGTTSTTGLPSQRTLDLDGISMSFPAAAVLQELELGTVTTINEDIYDDGSIYGGSSFLIGKAQGIYVASSEDHGNYSTSTSHMMAMTASFMSNGYKDCLRFFGVLHRTEVNVESHVAVIGGCGKYLNANGFATVKTVYIISSAADIESKQVYKLLLFNVNLG